MNCSSIVLCCLLVFLSVMLVNGGWGNWGSYSSCTRTCGGGSRTRYRSCNNPYPAFRGATCSGSGSETQSCNTYSCPVNGGWSSWSIVQYCTESCGGGWKKYMRRCNSPYPANGGSGCNGNGVESRRCNTHSCPEPTFEYSDGWTDMSSSMQNAIINLARDTRRRYGSSYETAKYMVKKIEQWYDGKWTVVVGEKIYRYTTYRSNHFTHFYLGRVNFVAFRNSC